MRSNARDRAPLHHYIKAMQEAPQYQHIISIFWSPQRYGHFFSTGGELFDVLERSS